MKYRMKNWCCCGAGVVLNSCSDQLNRSRRSRIKKDYENLADHHELIERKSGINFHFDAPISSNPGHICGRIGKLLITYRSDSLSYFYV